MARLRVPRLARRGVCGGASIARKPLPARDGMPEPAPARRGSTGATSYNYGVFAAKAAKQTFIPKETHRQVKTEVPSRFGGVDDDEGVRREVRARRNAVAAAATPGLSAELARLDGAEIPLEEWSSAMWLGAKHDVYELLGSLAVAESRDDQLDILTAYRIREPGARGLRVCRILERLTSPQERPQLIGLLIAAYEAMVVEFARRAASTAQDPAARVRLHHVARALDRRSARSWARHACIRQLVPGPRRRLPQRRPRGRVARRVRATRAGPKASRASDPPGSPARHPRLHVTADLRRKGRA
jgi:hypothetical protein